MTTESFDRYHWCSVPTSCYHQWGHSEANQPTIGALTVCSSAEIIGGGLDALLPASSTGCEPTGKKSSAILCSNKGTHVQKLLPAGPQPDFLPGSHSLLVILLSKPVPLPVLIQAHKCHSLSPCCLMCFIARSFSNLTVWYWDWRSVTVLHAHTSFLWSVPNLCAILAGHA